MVSVELGEILAFNHSFALLVKGLPKELEGSHLYLPSLDRDIYHHWKVSADLDPIPLTISYLSQFDTVTAKLIWAARNHGVRLFRALRDQEEDFVLPLIIDQDSLKVVSQVPIRHEFTQRFPWTALRMLKPCTSMG